MVVVSGNFQMHTSLKLSVKSVKLLGDRIAEIRIKAELGRAKLASDIGLSTAGIAKIENGENCPTLGVFMAIAKRLKADPSALLDGMSVVKAKS